MSPVAKKVRIGRRRAHETRGQAMVEFALVLPLIALALLALVAGSLAGDVVKHAHGNTDSS
jgi:Flp pilus assembly protein TadG